MSKQTKGQLSVDTRQVQEGSKSGIKWGHLVSDFSRRGAVNSATSTLKVTRERGWGWETRSWRRRAQSWGRWSWTPRRWWRRWWWWGGKPRREVTFWLDQGGDLDNFFIEEIEEEVEHLFQVNVGDETNDLYNKRFMFYDEQTIFILLHIAYYMLHRCNLYTANCIQHYHNKHSTLTIDVC